ncbi:MAG: aromatic ring-hydroxylating dioxygenase subunit alpha [Pseudomonadota bacterium]|nr:aromatic ring-hydroxylating dioxygenase subunit alpha [Pseudomonadota bacterium]
MSELAWTAEQFAARREGHSLPQGLYLDQRAYEFDLAAIYGHSWLMAGFECELPKPGSYLAMTVGKWPVLITRNRDGEIKAFHNSCRHRGSQICKPGSGSAARLVCPYHRWTYDLDGALLAAGRMPDNFSKTDHGLKPVAIACIAGGIFICLAETPPPIADFAAKFEAYAAPHDFKNAKLAASSVLVEHANWKLVMENARECYHCATGHPELSKTFPVGMSKHFDLGENARNAAFADRMDRLGLAHASVEGHWWQVARFALNEGCRSISGDGQHLSKKLMCETDEGDLGSMRWAIDPHLFAHATADHTFMFSCMPVGPTETHVFSKWLVHKDAVEGVDYQLDQLTDLWTLTNLQDKELAENNQAGVISPGYTPGPYSEDAEMLVMRFTDWYCDKARAYLAAHVD